MKILHAADLHIDSPLRGLSRYPGAPAEDLRLATRRALENLVQLAIDLSVDAVLLAGDVYDGEWRDYHTGLYFNQQMTRLGRAGIAVYMVSGNHDAQNRTLRKLRPPENVHLLATEKPETIRNDKIGLSVHGQGFARWDLTENLAAGYPPRDSGMFNVGLLHTALEGGNPDHQRYAPCSISDLEARGYHYWALGHIHKYRIVSEEPWIVYPGNLQGRHAREVGPKGCVIVTVDDTTLQVRSVDRHHMHAALWDDVTVDLAGVDDLDQALSLVQQQFQELPQDELVAVRVTLTGRTAAHTSLWRERDRLVNELRAAAGHHANLWLEKVNIRTSSEHLDTGDASGILADLRRTLGDLGASPHRLITKLEQHPIVGALPADVKGRDGIDLHDSEYLKRLTGDAYQLVESLLREVR
ncbi:DNA repair exonuclease [Actinomadura sp. NPDC047616]|uniref:metallophosphoesterase family protein n=1 Tax=Actinomadura sp. NPDC047616 TaxID=3155914 RepID=UPI0033CCAA6A